MPKTKNERVQLEMTGLDVASLALLAITIQTYFSDGSDAVMDAARALMVTLPQMAQAVLIAIGLWLLVTGVLNAIKIMLKMAIDLLEAAEIKEPRDPNYGAQP